MRHVKRHSGGSRTLEGADGSSSSLLWVQRLSRLLHILTWVVSALVVASLHAYIVLIYSKARDRIEPVVPGAATGVDASTSSSTSSNTAPPDAPVATNATDAADVDTNVGSSRHPKAPSHPHIVFLLFDDVGWNDFSYHGSNQCLTPTIDGFARQGLTLANYYVQPACSPTRSVLVFW
jgi:Sulfatase